MSKPIRFTDPFQDAALDVLIEANTKEAEKKWHEKDILYWFTSLVEEVGELGEALKGEHKDPPEEELIQIAGIAINFLRYLDRKNGRTSLEDS